MSANTQGPKTWRRWGMIALVSFALAGCAGAGTSDSTPAPTPEGSPTATSVAPPRSTSPASEKVTPPPGDAAAGRQALETPSGLLNVFLELARRDGDSGVQAMADSGDPSYIPVLVDFLRFSGLLGEDNRNTIIRTLFNLSGAAPNELTGSAQFWDWWVRWVGKHLELHGSDASAVSKGRSFCLLLYTQQSAFINICSDSRFRLAD